MEREKVTTLSLSHLQVDPETGRPSGCDCFSHRSDWRTSRIVDCPKQSYAPEGEPLHQIVEEYADNQDLWIKVSHSQYISYSVHIDKLLQSIISSSK